ncbi:HsdM family class I SAM-dependent methyltransferase [Thermoflavimicrobium daqui]|uniref:site-specific DNA-methyltransferase (adenine-specific) n=1 Tax=Thermoflavimicrobium daqui TaxID=2137476 RepID=A0A364K9I4_9BACL|nr:class I SAM-dependent DNA methyltransferase [Thermoflavimicrobium daqui]RAL26955.1 DNA methyltransferase [Thermoflavimicrobium daqui]
MIKGEIKRKVDEIWRYFWTGGITNPLTIIEQLTYLLFMKKLDDLEREQEENRKTRGIIYQSIFNEKQQLRWSRFKNLSADTMYQVVKEHVFPFIKQLTQKESNITRYLENAVFLIPTPILLKRVVEGIDQLFDYLPIRYDDFLGDLYEYLLSKLQIAKQNGQFRTPRHIIEMIIKMMKPAPSDRIMDPSVGTAGFLVLTSQYIRKHYPEIFTDREKNNLCKHFYQTMFYGLDIDMTMLRISTMNMILHGFHSPNILYHDAISKNYSQQDQFTLILANPPFKGSIDQEYVSPDLVQLLGASKNKPLKTELLFLALILRLLKQGGRCAIIVPEGVLFGRSKAHIRIRKELVEHQKVEAIISLPAGVFKPYASISTAVLIFTKTNKGGTNDVWFYEMKADGFSLDDKRIKLDENLHEQNNIPDIISRFENLEAEKGNQRTAQSFFVSIDEIRQNQYDLSIYQYKEINYPKIKYESPELILKQLRQLEQEIFEGIDELEAFMHEDSVDQS